MQTSSTLRSSRSRSRGFTLIEMMVSVAIVSVIMTIVIVNESHYSDATILNNTISDISIALRSAQVYGISVRESRVGSANFSSGYGIDFNTASGPNGGYISYVDVNQNNVYDSGTSCPTDSASECLMDKIFNNGITVSKICEIDLADNETCSPSRVDVTFVRPQSDANIVFLSGSGTKITLSGVKGARIELTSKTGLSRSVVIYTTGQISLK